METTLRPQAQEPYPSGPEQRRREQAIKRVQDKNASTVHPVAYRIINALFVVTWAVTGAGYF